VEFRPGSKLPDHLRVQVSVLLESKLKFADVTVRDVLLNQGYVFLFRDFFWHALALVYARFEKTTRGEQFSVAHEQGAGAR